MPGRLCARLLSLLLLGESLVPPVVGAMLAGGAVTEASAQTRSSGGYARPGSGYGRTPSFGSPRVAPRTPSTSGGYGRPALPDPGSRRRPSVNAPLPGAGSAWDRSYSRERSAEALNRMRRQQDTARQPREQPLPVPAPQPDPGWWRRGGTLDGGRPGNSRIGREGGWYRDRGWSPGGFPGLGQRSFGLWDGLFLWFLLNNLGRAGSTDFFHNHQDDPGYRQWRAEAERQAQDNAELRQRLDDLDRRLAERQGEPQDPGYLPPDVPPEIALAPRADARTPDTASEVDGGGGSPLIWLVVLGCGVFAVLTWRRLRAAPSPAQGGGPRPGHVLPDAGTAPRFRIGMMLTCDPTPFVLGGDALTVPPPASAEARISVQAVGRIREGSEELIRLYLPDGRSLFQIHPVAGGGIDECRYFTLIDEVVPADEAEWGAWLDPAQGMIGWPEFQTKDGKLYARLWAPGNSPVPPRVMVEAIESLDGTWERQLQSMLYAARTGAAAPAPETEYILVSAVEEQGRAWVEIRAGIDINPASLDLA